MIQYLLRAGFRPGRVMFSFCDPKVEKEMHQELLRKSGKDLVRVAIVARGASLIDDKSNSFKSVKQTGINTHGVPGIFNYRNNLNAYLLSCSCKFASFMRYVA